jgi:MoxR-like ATPase
VRGRWQVLETWASGAKLGQATGVSSLFAGESGIGKTLAAEVIARELGSERFRVDLAGW